MSGGSRGLFFPILPKPMSRPRRPSTMATATNTDKIPASAPGRDVAHFGARRKERTEIGFAAITWGLHPRLYDAAAYSAGKRRQQRGSRSHLAQQKDHG